MQIIVIKSSPHKVGASNMLADNFIEGAESVGHSVKVFDAGHADIHPCIACNACGMNGDCVFDDAIPKFQEDLLSSDMVVFATPLYYFGFSAQLKTVIDRFYNINSKITEKKLKSALLVSAWDNVEWALEDIENHYLTLCRYMHFENKGIVLGGGCGTPYKTANSVYPLNAYELGRSI